MSAQLFGILAAALTISTPLVWAALGAMLNERAGVLNLGIEGTMYSGAFLGFVTAVQTDSAALGVLAAILGGVVTGVLMAVLTVSLGVNQHVAGIGTTLLSVAAMDVVNRLMFGSGPLVVVEKFSRLFSDSGVFAQYPMTYLGLLVLAPGLWWLVQRSGIGLRLRAVGEHPEAAAVSGISVTATRYWALIAGSALMALGGSFLTLSLLGTFTVDIVSGRGWICIALVIFGRWRVAPIIAGALLFGVADAIQLQMAISRWSGWVPNELFIAFPYLVVIAALAIWGRGVRYPGAYLMPYRRS